MFEFYFRQLNCLCENPAKNLRKIPPVNRRGVTSLFPGLALRAGARSDALCYI
jgi:hypothetical protein